MKLKKIIFIVGPTAVGKSAVALKLAQRINAEIVSCDSMQIYKEINIASNKPSPEEQKLVKHHLINIISVQDKFDVAKFNSLANKATVDILKRKKIPIIVGGSGLYMQILLDGIFKGAKPDEKIRQKLQKQAEEFGPQYLYEQLKKVDAHSAKKIHQNDVKRIVRALEVYHTKKKPMSKLKKTRQGLWGKYDIKLFSFSYERERLYEKINKRVEDMFDEGLVKEIQALALNKLSLTVQALIGVKEVLGYLNKEYDLDRAKYLMKLNTRHLAKRQYTWFRKESRLTWIDVDQKSADEIVKQLLEKI